MLFSLDRGTSLREHNLVMLFGKFGYVQDAEIIYNDMGSKGFGFVTMMRGQDAYRALLKLNNTTIEGRIILVSLFWSLIPSTFERANPSTLSRSTWLLPRSMATSGLSTGFLQASLTLTLLSDLSLLPKPWPRLRPGLPRPSWRSSRSARS